MKAFLPILLVAGSLLLGASTRVTAQDQPQTQVGGYGELHYNEYDGSRKGMLDLHRFVLYFNRNFNDWISFASEFEIEHVYVSGESNRQGGYMSIEQAYLEFRPWKNFGFRGGILLVPVGIVNLVHEPNTFHGVERPIFHRSIVPSTWREAGAGVFGKLAESVSFELYTMAGLQAKNFNAGDALRNGRQLGLNSSTANMSLTGRVGIHAMAGLQFGVSGFFGSSTGGVDSLGSGAVSLLAAEASYSVGNLALRAEGAMLNVGDAEKIHAAYKNNIADQSIGWYVEAAYNFLPHLVADTEQRMAVFARLEKINTQADVSYGDPLKQHDRTIVTTGLTYHPHSDVVVKLDYQFFSNARDDKSTGQLNAGIGYAFF